jgi:hypothetical protein
VEKSITVKEMERFGAVQGNTFPTLVLSGCGRGGSRQQGVIIGVVFKGSKERRVFLFPTPKRHQVWLALKVLNLQKNDDFNLGIIWTLYLATHIRECCKVVVQISFWLLNYRKCAIT